MSKIITTLTATVTALALAVGGCTFTDDLSGQIQRVSDSVEKSQEEALLTNVVRTGDGAPMSFTQVSTVLGTGSVNGTVGLPFATFGPGAPPLTITKNGFGIAGNNSVGASSGNNFNLSVLETKEFWLGMLTPLSIDTLNFFVRSGVPRELLFYLYIQRIEISAGKDVNVLVNDPDDPSFPGFRKQMAENLQLGLTTDTVMRTAPVGPPLKAADAHSVKDLVEMAKAGLALKPVPSAGKGKGEPSYQMMQGKAAAVLCFDPVFATLDTTKYLPPEFTCDAVTKAAAPGADSGGVPFSFEKKGGGSAARPNIEYKIYPRSTYDIIRYLGMLAMAGIDRGEYIDLVTRSAKEIGDGDPLARRLFVVQKNAGSGDDFISIKYRGDTYSIPMSATPTVRIFALVRQLIALSTSVNSLPTTGTVITAH
jgi:hypothetical protein